MPHIVLVDGILLRRLLTNLLSNAIKFTDRGQVTLLAEYHEGRLALAVKDTGIGISEQDRPKLFHKFVQLEAAKTKRYGGTGPRPWALSATSRRATWQTTLPIRSNAFWCSAAHPRHPAIERFARAGLRQ